MGSILKISEACSLALHSMIVLAERKDRFVSAKEIAEVLEVSSNHLSKVLQRLSKAKLVASVKGLNGGFKLAKSPNLITFLTIYEAVEGKFEPNNCLLGNKNCKKRTSCNMGPLVTSINSQIYEYFKTTKLSQFA